MAVYNQYQISIKHIFYILFIFLASSVFSQNYLDTLAKKIGVAKNDSAKINLYYKFSLADKKLSSSQRDSLYNLIIETGKNSKNKRMLAFALYKQGYFHDSRSENNKAIEKYFSALKEAEKIGFIWIRLMAHNRIGSVYMKEKNHEFSLKQYHYSIALAKQINDSANLSEGYAMLATIYNNYDKLDSSLFYNHKALEIREVFGVRVNLANSYNNLGLTYKSLKQYDKSLEYLQKSLKIREEEKDYKGIAGSNINIANVLRAQKKYKEALKYAEAGTNIAFKNKIGDFYLNGLFSQAEVLYKLGMYKESVLMFRICRVVGDSIKKEKINTQVAELQSKYDSDKKDADLKLKEEQIKSKTAQNSKQKILIVASCIALLMALLAVFFIYRSFRLNKRNAVQLAFKNHLIEEKNKEITDSINYARLIQQSLLASESMLDENLNEYFILYKPKDIVSGDFYWASETHEGFLLACVDCTGHGVPGAFMSLIGKENLDKAIVKTSSPKQILTELNKGVKRSLNQNSPGNNNRDGMDAAIVRIEKSNNTVSKVYYSGANRPLWIIRKATGALEEIKPTKQAIGGFTTDSQEFEEHELILNNGDMIYISTDGYADQFGSDKNKKLTTKRFKDLLISIHSSKAKEQKQELEGFFTNWKGKSEQLDDLLVIGIKI
ncbi:MAG: tetratricopeptide repeat protein [Bacteroidota bacterium]|nr:tetratricopeptide repeat protein [Bacteroidota bacterium]